jgi:hypothetical protein
MNHIRTIVESSRDKHFALVATTLCLLAVFSHLACSISSSEQKQSTQQIEAIQGDPIDAPAAVSTPRNEPQDAKKSGELPAQRLHAATEKNAGPESVAPNLAAIPSTPATLIASTSTKTAPAESVLPEKSLTPAGKEEDERPPAELLAAPAQAAVTPAPEAAGAPAAPGSNNNSGYQRITLGLLGNFRYEYPDPIYLESEQDPSKLKLKDQFPPNIKALHGEKVSIMGYIMPIDVDEQWRVKTFTLVRDQMVCCFGNVPEINEWVYVRLKAPQRADQLIDVPVIVFGTLEVGEEIKFGTLANVYRIEADRVSTNY